MPVDLCPWLGTGQDRQVRHAAPAEVHRCHARRRPAGLDLEYQARFCLAGAHRECEFYLEPPAVAEVPVAVALAAEEDEVGPPPRRLSPLQGILWVVALLVAAAVIYSYGSALLAAPPAATPAVGATVTASPSASPTSTALAPSAEPATASATSRTTATPTSTPYPGGVIYTLSPQAGAAGWVAGDESRGNHLGDSYMYAGTFGGVIYHGIVQLDLRVVPRGATIHSGVLELTGLDAQRLGSGGTWEVRILARDADADWSRGTFQDVHNAAVQWSLTPALAAGELAAGETRPFALSPDMLRDLEQRLLDEHYTVSVRIDGPLAGEDSLFAWDSGSGPSSKGYGPRLVLNTGRAPRTPIPTGPLPPTNTPTPSATPTATETPEWFVVTSTPTPENAMTAAAVALRATALATTTGTPTPLPPYVATATPDYGVVTHTPTPANQATAVYLRGLATANVVLTGTPTPPPPNLVTATFTPRPTRTPAYQWLDELAGTTTPTPTPTPTTPPIPAGLVGKILFLSDRGDQGAVYMLDPGSGRVALLTARWPYDVAMQRESLSPDGLSRAYVQNDGRNVPQVYVHSTYYGSSWQVTYNTRMSYDPVWSPAGDRVAFVSAEGGNDELYVIGSDGNGQQRLTFNQWEWDKHPSWSPDGQQIVFWSNEGSGRRQLWIINADGSGRRTLLDSDHNDWDPVWVK